MNEKNLKALLKGLGISETVITESDKDDFDVKAAVAAFNESQKAHYTDIISNEIRPTIEDEVTAKVEGKIYGTLNNDLKKIYGVPLDKIKDLPVHEKLKVVKAQLDETYSKNPSADEIKKLQEEKMEWQNKYTDFEQKFNSELGNAIKAEKQKTVAKLTEAELQKKFNSVPAEKLLGGAHSEGIYFGTKTYLSTKYDFDTDANDNMIIYTKGTQQRATIKDAAGKESFVTLDDLMLNSLKELKFLKESNGGEGSGNGGKGANGNGQKTEKSARLLEMEAKVSQLQ